MRRIVVFGATSAIAMETARHFAQDGDAILLVARDDQKLEAVQNDLLTRGAKEVYTLSSDLADIESHGALLQMVRNVLPDFDTVLVAYGSLADQKKCELDFALTEKELTTNFLSVVSLVTPLANRLEEAAQSGKPALLAVITSVAGDRGRQSNYIYGSAKGALHLFLQGLRSRLHSSGVTVLTIKPGFVDTPMTAHMKKGLLFSSPQTAGHIIYQAIKKRRDVVYVPWFWYFIMLVIRLIPESLFKRLKL